MGVCPHHPKYRPTWLATGVLRPGGSLLRRVNVLGSRSDSRSPLAGVAVMRLGLHRHERSVRVGALEDMRTGLVSSASSGGTHSACTVQPRKSRGLLEPVSAATGRSRSLCVLQRSEDGR